MHKLLPILALAACLPWLLVPAPLQGSSPGADDPAVATADPGVFAARRFRAEHGAEILRDFAELLAIPNVASDLPTITENARVIRDGLAQRGVEATLWTLPDFPEAPPIVYGALDVPGATRTLGVYVHYDGQPVDPSAWTTGSPWEAALYTGPVEAGGTRRPLPADGEAIDPAWYLYARGAGDDKAPIPAFFAALDALAEAGISPTSNLRFLFEGEEEAGSPHLAHYLLDAHREELSADAWLIFDGPVHQSRRPLLAFGVRGYTGFDLTTYGATRYLHSGHYGNWAPNPAMELAQLLASMKNASGEVTIQGFYDSTVPPGEAEREAMLSVPDYDDSLRAELGLGATEAGNAPLVERLLLPSFNVRGMESAAVGPAARNVIPTEATASVDVRLAKGNDPEAMLDLVEAHLEGLGYTVLDRAPTLEDRFAHPKLVRLDRRGGYPAARTSLDSRVAREVTGAVQRAAAGPNSAIGEGLEDVVLLPTLGGSLPLYLFVEKLDAPVVIVPMANHDDNQHAPDENIRLANLWYGIDLAAAVLTME